MSQFISCLQLYHKSKSRSMPFIFNLQMSIYRANFRWNKNFQTIFFFFFTELFQWRLYERDFMLSLKPELIRLLHYSPVTNTRCPHSRHQYFSDRHTPQQHRCWRRRKHNIQPKLSFYNIFHLVEQMDTVLPSDWGAAIGCAATKRSVLEVKSESHQIKEGWNEATLKHFFFNV